MCLGEIVRLEDVQGSSGVAQVGERAVRISLVTLDGPVAPGDWVLVHSGFALRRLDPAEAAGALSLREHPAPRTLEGPTTPDSRHTSPQERT